MNIPLDEFLRCMEHTFGNMHDYNSMIQLLYEIHQKEHAIKQEIHINNDEPFKECFRCIPLPLLEEVHASLRDMLDAGAIQLSQSPWCNAVVLVQKKDGSLQFCIDFRLLNVRTKKDLYPLPRI